jgi:hypothetical protein
MKVFWGKMIERGRGGLLLFNTGFFNNFVFFFYIKKVSTDMAPGHVSTTPCRITRLLEDDGYRGDKTLFSREF